MNRSRPDKGSLTPQARWSSGHRALAGNWGSETWVHVGRRGSRGWTGRAMNPKVGGHGVGKGHGMRRVCGGCLGVHAPGHG